MTHKIMHQICTIYGYISIISDSQGGQRQHTTNDIRPTTPGVWHKLPGGEV